MSTDGNQSSKTKLFSWPGIFSLILISKMGVKMNLWIVMNNYATDREIGSHKIDFKAVWQRNGHSDSVGVELSHNNQKISRKISCFQIFIIISLFDPISVDFVINFKCLPGSSFLFVLQWKILQCSEYICYSDPLC